MTLKHIADELKQKAVIAAPHPDGRGNSMAAECMRNIERVTNGGPMSSAQRHVYESCRRVVESKAVIPWGSK